LAEIFEEFIGERERIGIRPKTLAEFRTSFKWFNDFFVGRKGIRDFTSHDIREYKNALVDVPADFTNILSATRSGRPFG